MIGVIIQARMGSSRLPGKVLMKIGDKTLLEHIFFRLSFLQYPVDVVLATTISKKDNIIEDFCIKNNIKYFRGSELNVLERYYSCAKKYNYDHIIRLTADNPFLDIEELDNLIKSHLNSSADYSHSFNLLPKGVGAEIMSFEALEKSLKNASKQKHFEHVNEYILDNRNLFNINSLNSYKDKRKSDVSLTVDTQEDYLKACYIFDKSSNKLDLKEILYWESLYRLEK